MTHDHLKLSSFYPRFGLDVSTADEKESIPYPHRPGFFVWWGCQPRVFFGNIKTPETIWFLL
jgi:hypothetical protein